MAYEWINPAIQTFLGAYGAYQQSGNAAQQMQAGQQAAALADPFMNQRAQFIPFLQNQVFGGNPYDAGNLQPIAPDQYDAPLTNTTGYFANLGSVGQNLEQTPGYQFRLNRGMEAVGRSNAAKGLLNSGNTLAGLSDYAQDYASQEYQNEYNRQMGQAQAMGQAQNQYYQGALAGNQANWNNANSQFNQLANIYNMGNQQYNQQLATLGQLTGATTGSGAAAGQAIMGGVANSQAAYDQYLQTIGGTAQGIGQIFTGNQ